MRRTVIVAVGLVLLLVGVGVWQLLRSPVRVTSEVDADVTVVCSASSGLDQAACGAWGDETLAAGPPSTTFELRDLARLELSRSWFGLGECRADYFLGRYPESSVWTDTVDCPDGP